MIGVNGRGLSVPSAKTDVTADADRSKMEMQNADTGPQIFANHGCVTVVQSWQKNLTQLKLTDGLFANPFLQTIAAHSLREPQVNLTEWSPVF